MSQDIEKFGAGYPGELEKVATLDQGVAQTITRQLGDDTVDAAKAGAHAQQTMTVREALKKYPVAVGFSILYST